MFAETYFCDFKSDNGQLCPYDGAELTVQGDILTCAPADLICSRNTSITLFDSTAEIPPSCKYKDYQS